MLDGKSESFPKSNPVFRFAGTQGASISIAPVAGGLADGSSALTLKKGHAVTLVNTSDKKRYVLLFVGSGGAS